MGIKLLIVDDHGVLRAGLRALLSREADLEIVGEAENGSEAIRQAVLTKPDIVLMDITLPDINGLEASKEILRQLPGIKVLMLTVHSDNGLVREAIRLGAAGYVLKQAVELELITAIHAVMRGGLYIDPSITRTLFTNQSQVMPSIRSDETITPRETEVLRLIARGYTNRQIADQLCISVRTVESHRANIMEKLNLDSRVELVRYARQNEMLK